MSTYQAGKTVVLQKIGDLATDEINLQLISDIHELVGSQGTQTLLDRAVAASERVDLDLERLISYLDFSSWRRLRRVSRPLATPWSGAATTTPSPKPKGHNRNEEK